MKKAVIVWLESAVLGQNYQQFQRPSKAGTAIASLQACPACQGGIAKKMEERTGQPGGQELKERSLLVLYGTETGHSKEIAEEIVEAAERLRFKTSIEQMNNVSLVSLPCQAFTMLLYLVY